MVALQLYDSNGFPYMTASFNPVQLGKYHGKNRLIAIKDWSENEGIEPALLDNHVLEELVGTIPTGYVNGKLYKVDKEFLGKK